LMLGVLSFMGFSLPHNCNGAGLSGALFNGDSHHLLLPGAEE